MTNEELQKKLEKGVTLEEIRAQYIREVNVKRYNHLARGTMNLASLKASLKRIEIDLDTLPSEEGYYGPSWTVKLKNTEIRISDRSTKGHPTLALWYYNNLKDHTNGWYLSGKDPDSVVSSILEADAHYPELISRLSEIDREYNKFQTIKNISQESISLLLKEKFSGSGLKYNLTLQPTKVLFKVKLKRSRFFEVALPHDNFANILTDSFVSEIKRVAESIDGLKYNIRIARYGSSEKWFESESTVGN